MESEISAVYLGSLQEEPRVLDRKCNVGRGALIRLEVGIRGRKPGASGF